MAPGHALRDLTEDMERGIFRGSVGRVLPAKHGDLMVDECGMFMACIEFNWI